MGLRFLRGVGVLQVVLGDVGVLQLVASSLAWTEVQYVCSMGGLQVGFEIFRLF